MLSKWNLWRPSRNSSPAIHRKVLSQTLWTDFTSVLVVIPYTALCDGYHRYCCPSTTATMVYTCVYSPCARVCAVQITRNILARAEASDGTKRSAGVSVYGARTSGVGGSLLCWPGTNNTPPVSRNNEVTRPEAPEL